MIAALPLATLPLATSSLATLPLATLHWVDWAIVGLYAGVVVLIAWLARRRQKNADDYLLGGRRLRWWLVGLSIIATAFSTISLLSWTGKGYTSGFMWFQLQVGELVAILVVCAVFLPFFARLRLTTAYEYLEVRFGPRVRWVASLFFHLFVVARAGLFLFLTARALSVFTDLDVGLCIALVGVSAMIYSSTGGLGAVVWTDGLQFLLILVGVGASVVLVLGDLPGGLGDVVGLATAEGRPPPVSLDPSPQAFPSLWSAILAYGVLALSVGGTNQQAVQRYLACVDLQAARRAALLSWAMGALVVLLTLGLGMALFLRYDGAEMPTDDVFATFVVRDLPVGLAGVMAAAVFAASMSSIDSAIHAMATATLVDFVERLRREPLPEARRLRAARLLTLAYGVVAVGAAFYAMAQGQDVIDLLFKWVSMLMGPILALFLLAMGTRRVREGHALLGLLVGYLTVLVVFKTDLLPGQEISLAAGWGVHGIWSGSVGAVVTLALALAACAADRGRGRPGNPSDRT